MDVHVCPTNILLLIGQETAQTPRFDLVTSGTGGGDSSPEPLGFILEGRS